LGIICGQGHEHADTSHAHNLLRTHSTRPSGRGTCDQFDELAPPHCLTQARDYAD
jgi:hypothetical protein